MAYLRLPVFVTCSIALCSVASAQVLTSSAAASDPSMPRLDGVQAPPSAPAVASESVPAVPPPVPPPVPTAAPAAPDAGVPPPPHTPASEARSDHDHVVSKLGIGWEGFPPTLNNIATPGSGLGNLPTGPMVGVRWWFSDRVGLDVALGVALSSGGGSISGVEEEDPPVYFPSSRGFLLRAGVPWVLYARSHYAFLAQAHLLVGYARSVETREIDDGFEKRESKTVQDSFRFDATLTAGAELHFGFIGVPELSLQGTVGLGVTHARWSRSNEGVTERRHQTLLATTLGNAPWDFFRTAVAARYYF